MSKSPVPNLSEQPKRIREFIKYVRKVCNKHDIELYIGKGSHIVYPLIIDGEFKRGSKKAMGMGCFIEDEETGFAKLMVATKRPRWQWLGTLAHELCHVMQWLECEPTYYGTQKMPGADASAFLDEWLEFETEFPKRTIRRAVQLTVDCELDNEKRSLRMLKKFKLPVDEKRYIQAANSYLFFHQVMFENRTWYNKKMFDPQVLDHMPDHFLPDASYKIGKMPREYVEYLEAIVINKNGWSWKNRNVVSAKRAAEK